MFYSYQQRIMNSQARINVVQAPRRTGRTHLCIEWLLANGVGTVLYVAAHQQQLENAASYIKDNYSHLITSQDQKRIKLRTGLSIFFPTPTEFKRQQGLRCDRIAFDDAGLINWLDAVDILPALHDKGQVLAIGDDAKAPSILDYFLANIGSRGYYDQYTFEEAVEEGLFTNEAYSQTRDFMDPVKFRKEFGPWDRITDWHSKRKNRDYVGILNK